MPKDWYYVRGIYLRRARRREGRAWPGCDGRSVHSAFDWCDAHGVWEWGEHHFCDFHAGMLVAGRLPDGINADGHWPKSRLKETDAAQG